MPRPSDQLDDLLRKWPYEFGEVTARRTEGKDGREVLQLRIDMGVLQMETSGKPDGSQPDGYASYYDYLIAMAFAEGEQFVLHDERCQEVDREFVQYYHRRVTWLALREFRRAVLDADHTLGLMDFTSAHAPDEEWADMHEQYRPFVLFHRTQAAALAEVDDFNPENAVKVLDAGLAKMADVFRRQDMIEDFEEDELIIKLSDMKRTLHDHYELQNPLAEQLAEAIAHEEYERAAELRDRMRKHKRRASEPGH